MNVSLDERFERLVKAKVRSGRYRSARQVVQSALELLDTQEKDDKTKLAELRALVQEGVDAANRGEVMPLDLNDLLAQAHAEHAARRKRRHGKS